MAHPSICRLCIYGSGFISGFTIPGEGVNKTVCLQVGDAPKPVLGDSLNMQIPWCGDARPASQVGNDPISSAPAWTRFPTFSHGTLEIRPGILDRPKPCIGGRGPAAAHPAAVRHPPGGGRQGRELQSPDV